MNFPQFQGKKTIFTSSNSNGKSLENTYSSTRIPNDNYRLTDGGNSVMKSNITLNNMMAGNNCFGNNFIGSNFIGNNMADQSQRQFFIGQPQANNLIPCNMSQTTPFSNGLLLNQQNNLIGKPLFIQQTGSSIVPQPTNYNHFYLIMPRGLAPFTK